MTILWRKLSTGLMAGTPQPDHWAGEDLPPTSQHTSPLLLLGAPRLCPPEGSKSRGLITTPSHPEHLWASIAISVASIQPAPKFCRFSPISLQPTPHHSPTPPHPRSQAIFLPVPRNIPVSFLASSLPPDLNGPYPTCSQKALPKLHVQPLLLSFLNPPRLLGPAQAPVPFVRLAPDPLLHPPSLATSFFLCPLCPPASLLASLAPSLSP